MLMAKWNVYFDTSFQNKSSALDIGEEMFKNKITKTVK